MKTRITRLDYGVVPALRAQLVEAMENAENSRTQKLRAENLGMAYAYATALRLLRNSGADWPEGIAPREVGLLTHTGIAAARRYVGPDHLDLLGPTDEPPVIAS